MNPVSKLKMCIIIPARMESSRFPGKVLWKFHNMPMIEHVYRRACMAFDSQDVYVTSGDREILSYMESIGANVLQNIRTHSDGTSRAAEAADSLNYDYIIVLQADEILIDPEHLSELYKNIIKSQDAKYWNLITCLKTDLELIDPNIVKCALNKKREILFIFRQNPFISLNHKIFYKIMGTIAFEYKSLVKLSSLPDSPLQIANSTEQLKILEDGHRIKAVYANDSYPSINSQNDIKVAKLYTENSSRQKMLFEKYVNIRS